jgi:hypothetical protein
MSLTAAPTFTLRCPQWDGVKHFITYDRTSVHKPPHAPSTTASRCTGSTRLHPTGVQSRTTKKSIGEEDIDLPPLLDEEDDEDIEDNNTLSQYQAESNRWLLFVCVSCSSTPTSIEPCLPHQLGVFALIVTLFIVNFSKPPHQSQARKQSQLILSHLAALTEQMEASPRLSELSDSFSATLRTFNLSAYLDPTPPTLAMEIRDEWAPALWYSSLMITLMGMMITLLLKHWLMACTFATWPTLSEYELCDLEDALEEDNNSEHGKGRVWPDMKTRKEALERLKTLRNMQAQRKAERRRTRRETMKKTERIKSAVPWLIFSALAMFVFGLVAKVGGLLWIGHA